MEAGVETLGSPSAYACPECHGVLLQMQEGGLIRFRCHTGHAYSAESLLAAAREAADEALWTAVRALEEGALLMNGLAAHVRTHDQSGRAQEMLRQAEEAHRRAERVRQVAMLPESALAAAGPADAQH